ncbi:MAG: tRNA (uridine(34)/cytosine(34)/5-carboxymethylaminomethyluridine(34)-2'-O)-methyltransferase TrmL [bacterium]
MFHIVFFSPQIPPNTGNAIRLCANTPTTLHLIHPLGFEMSDKQLRRAGLDYHEFSTVQEHSSLDEFLNWLGEKRLFAITTKGQRCYTDPTFNSDDVFIFGNETSGLPEAFLNSLDAKSRLRIPMCEGMRSLNLSNSAAIVVYEVWRQFQFKV